MVQQSRDIVTGVLWNVRHNLNNDAVINKIIKLIGSRGFQEDIIHLKPHDNKPPENCELNKLNPQLMTPLSTSQDHVSELKLLPLNFINVLSKVIDSTKSALTALMRMTLDL